jgi:hypothetical protein
MTTVNQKRKPAVAMAKKCHQVSLSNDVAKETWL